MPSKAIGEWKLHHMKLLTFNHLNLQKATHMLDLVSSCSSYMTKSDIKNAFIIKPLFKKKANTEYFSIKMIIAIALHDLKPFMKTM